MSGGSVQDIIARRHEPSSRPASLGSPDKALQHGIIGATGAHFKQGALSSRPPIESRAVKKAVISLHEVPLRREAISGATSEVIKDLVATPVRAYFEDGPDVVAAAILGRPVKRPIESLTQSCVGVAAVGAACGASKIVQHRVAATVEV